MNLWGNSHELEVNLRFWAPIENIFKFFFPFREKLIAVDFVKNQNFSQMEQDECRKIILPFYEKFMFTWKLYLGPDELLSSHLCKDNGKEQENFIVPVTYYEKIWQLYNKLKMQS